MARVKRAAHFVATLVYADEPQVIHLMSKTVPMVAVAIPSDNQPEASMFVATTATQQNWRSYLNGASDLRYLFTYPSTRSIYTFDMHKIKDNRVLMTPWEGDIPEDYLPQPQFFSRFHTEDFSEHEVKSQTEKLLVDGDWELQEFGRFYQKYSDVYAFLVAIMNWNSAAIPLETKGKIKAAFSGKPFEGGSSYLHFFGDLFSSLRQGERLGLDKVQYASPGYVDVNGREEAFDSVELSLSNFLENHAALHKAYVEFRSSLSKNGYLAIAGINFPASDPAAPVIKERAAQFAALLRFDDFDQVYALAEQNALVSAKIMLSYYRRLEQAAEFFAQGRVAFAD